jgi:uncharacterized oligopeptide transporter (OPT) family protein
MPEPSADRPAGEEEGGGAENELTFRAVLLGALLGVVFAVGNVYVGLKTGLADAATVTTAILGFAAMKTFAKRPYSALENNITQNVASSAATMPAAMGFLGSFPALTMMGYQRSGWVLLAWGLSIGLLGILLALPLRERFLADPSMPFPFAVATAEVIRAMHRSGASAIGKARALVSAGLVSGAITWFRDGRPKVFSGVYFFPWTVVGSASPTFSLGMTMSPLLLALGSIVGMRTGLGLLIGGVLGWAVLAPALVLAQIVTRPTYDALGAWLMWPGVAMMIASAMTPIARDGRLWLRSVRDLRAVGASFPARALAAVAVIAGFLVLLGWASFDVHPAVILGAIAISVAMAVVMTRSAGETGVLPLVTAGQITQLLLGPLVRAPAGSIIAGSIPAGDCGQTGQTLETLKVGQMLGASSGAQIRAQIAGALVGAPFAAGAYVVLVHAYALGGEALPAPTASPWKLVAELMAQGTATIPHYAGAASLVAAGLGVVLSILESTRAARFVPSPLAIGLAFLLGAAASFTIAAGAIAGTLLRRARREWYDEYGSSIAVGGLVGEALMGLVIASLLVRHVLEP